MSGTRTIRQILTARDRHWRLTELEPLRRNLSDHHLPTVWISSARRFQSLLGFGGAFTEAAAVTWRSLSDDLQQALLRAYFAHDHGHGYSLCRVPIGSCDFALGNYSHLEDPGDRALETFSIHRDREAILPLIKAAQLVAGRPIKLLASPWSPPSWMKSTGQMNHGGVLLPQYRPAWAACYVNFIRAYEAEGVPIWGVSVQNEPMAVQRWESCIYSAEEERDFVRDHLGPSLEAAGLGHIRIIIWDHNRDQMVARAATVYSDAQAARYVWGTGFHWYGEDHFDHVQLVHDAWPDKHLLFTEGCQEGGPHHGSWELGERYGRSMINDLNRWTVGWIDWNLLLNDRGGPNHVGNLCSAPMLAAPAHDALLPQSSYFYIGHFARYIQPGATRILCAATSDRLETTAFINPDGSLAAVVMNRTEDAQHFELHIEGDRYLAELPSRSIATYVRPG